MRWWSLARAGTLLCLAAAGGYLIAVGPPDVKRRIACETRTERLGTPPADRPDGPYERVIEVPAMPESALRDVAVVPDPLARRTRVVAGAPPRVLDPAAVELSLLALPRSNRPLPLGLRISGARPDDRVSWNAGTAPAEVAGVVRDGVLHASFALAELTGETELRVEWAGERDGRKGRVVRGWRITPAPPPVVALHGVDVGGPLARALRLQGFTLAKSPEEGDLFVVAAGLPAPLALTRRVDRGAGLLLIADADAGLHPSFVDVAPVVAAPLPAGPRAAAPDRGPAVAAGARTAGEEDRRAPKERAGAADPNDPGLRRAGGVTDEEKSRAAKETRRRRTRSVAVVLLIDRSESMNRPLATPRIEMAKRGAAATARTLADTDELALVSFGSRPEVVLPLGPAARRDDLDRALQELCASAATTKCYPGLEVAWRILKTTASPVRHVVLLTDGEFVDMGRPYRETLKSMRREGIGVSGLGVLAAPGGLGIEQFAALRDMLGAAGGQLTVTDDPRDIPRLMLGEVREVVGAARPLAAGPGKAAGGAPAEQPAATREPAENRPAHEVAGPPLPAELEGPEPPAEAPRHPLHVVDIEPVLSGLDVDWPAVLRYPALEARRRARVHLAVGGAGHAFLATAPYGLGRVAVLASGDGGPATAELRASPWYPRLVGQLAAWLLPAERLGAARDERSRVETGAAELAEGRGLAPGTLADVAMRAGGSLDAKAGAHVMVVEPGDPAPWLLALAGAFLALLIADRAVALRRA